MTVVIDNDHKIMATYLSTLSMGQYQSMQLVPLSSPHYQLSFSANYTLRTDDLSKYPDDILYRKYKSVWKLNMKIKNHKIEACIYLSLTSASLTTFETIAIIMVWEAHKKSFYRLPKLAHV